MRRHLFIAASAIGAATAHAAGLTPAETRWHQASAPVLAHAEQHRLPVDIWFDPRATAGDPPLSVGFAAGRCKLVFAIRGNPDADAILSQVDPDLASAVIEAMTAHELGHCWRYVQGAWHTTPAGFVNDNGAGPDRELARVRRDMRETRREEGYADLVGLAWTLAHHPERYEQVHDWFCRVRDDQPVPGAHHDTRAWLRLARDRAAFPALPNLFEQVLALWQVGLGADD